MKEACCNGLAQTSSLYVVVKVTEACNMGCRYCSAEKDLTKAPILGKRVGERIIDSLADLGLSSYSVCFHGGEPLLGIDAIKNTVEYAKCEYSDIPFRFSIQSNLVRMNEDIAQWCSSQAVSVGFSIDGSPDVNDQNRVFHDGSGTTGSTLAGLKILQNYQPRVGCVAVIGSHNWDRTREFTEFLATRNVYQLALNRLAPVGKALSVYQDLSPTDAQYAACLRDCYFTMVESDFKIRVKPIMDWAHKIIDPHSVSHGCYQCGAGWSHVSVDPEGNVYACDRFSFDPTWVSGNLLQQDLLDILNENKMRQCRTRTTRIAQCAECAVAYVCGGSCAVTSYYRCGTVDVPGHECGNMRDFIPWLEDRLFSHDNERIAIDSLRLGVEPVAFSHALKTD